MENFISSLIKFKLPKSLDVLDENVDDTQKRLRKFRDYLISMSTFIHCDLLDESVNSFSVPISVVYDIEKKWTLYMIRYFNDEKHLSISMEDLELGRNYSGDIIGLENIELYQSFKRSKKKIIDVGNTKMKQQIVHENIINQYMNIKKNSVDTKKNTDDVLDDILYDEVSYVPFDDRSKNLNLVYFTVVSGLVYFKFRSLCSESDNILSLFDRTESYNTFAPDIDDTDDDGGGDDNDVDIPSEHFFDNTNKNNEIRQLDYESTETDSSVHHVGSLNMLISMGSEAIRDKTIDETSVDIYKFKVDKYDSFSSGFNDAIIKFISGFPKEAFIGVESIKTTDNLNMYDYFMQWFQWSYLYLFKRIDNVEKNKLYLSDYMVLFDVHLKQMMYLYLSIESMFSWNKIFYDTSNGGNGSKSSNNNTTVVQLKDHTYMFESIENHHLFFKKNNIEELRSNRWTSLDFDHGRKLKSYTSNYIYLNMDFTSQLDFMFESIIYYMCGFPGIQKCYTTQHLNKLSNKYTRNIIYHAVSRSMHRNKSVAMYQEQLYLLFKPNEPHKHLHYYYEKSKTDRFPELKHAYYLTLFHLLLKNKFNYPFFIFRYFVSNDALLVNRVEVVNRSNIVPLFVQLTPYTYQLLFQGVIYCASVDDMDGDGISELINLWLSLHPDSLDQLGDILLEPWIIEWNKMVPALFELKDCYSSSISSISQSFKAIFESFGDKKSEESIRRKEAMIRTLDKKKRLLEESYLQSTFKNK
jgi:hypothetical protein